MYKKLYISLIFIFFCNPSISQNYLTVTNPGTIDDTYRLFRTIAEDHNVRLSYTANELNSISVGDSIFSIGFYVIDRLNRDYEFQVMYNAEIKIIENGITKSVWTGNLAPNEDQWNDIMFDVPYVRSSNNSLTIEFCFNNCEFTSSFLVRNRTNGTDFQHSSSNGTFYGSNNSQCSNNVTNNRKRPDTRFGLSNSINNQNISICGSGSNVILTANSFSTIPNSFVYFNNNPAWTYTNPQGITSKYYRIESGRKRNWLEADHHCQSLGGNLVHIENQAENNIVDLIPTTDPNGNGRNWIGGFQNCNNQSYSDPNGGWEWSSGDLINNTSYNNWANNEPNNSNGEYAIEMLSNGTWNDEDIKGDDRRYIMEIQDKYVWSTGDVTSSPSITVNPFSTTLYWVDRIQSNGIQREYFTVFVKQTPTLTINNPIPSNIVCSGDTISVSVNSNIATSYLWENNFTSFTSANSNQNFIIDDTSKVIVTAQASNGCSTKDSLFLYSYPEPEININVIDSSCQLNYAYAELEKSNYCLSQSGDPNYCNISNVILVGNNSTISNNTSLINSNYSDFTNLYTELSANQSYNLSVTLETDFNLPLGGKVFIDWNSDGDFFDNLEEISLLQFNNTTTTHSITINVPSFAINDTTRMRVVSQYSATSDTSFGPCDVGSLSPFFAPVYGETEDYNIYINSANTTNFNFIWSDGNIGSLNDSLSAGTYSLTITDNNGCVSQDSVNVGESGYISVSADSNQTICYGGQPSNLTSQSLNSLPSSNIQWNPSNFFVNSNISNPQFINGFSLFSDTVFTVTYNNGVCSSTDTVRIDVNQRPSVSNIIINPLPACENDTLTIFAITSSLNITEFRFQQRTQSNNIWTNINAFGNGWGISNPIIYGPINETTEFRVKIREGSGCSPSEWGGPTNQGVIVPINNMNNLLIYHN